MSLARDMAIFYTKLGETANQRNENCTVAVASFLSSNMSSDIEMSG